MNNHSSEIEKLIQDVRRTYATCSSFSDHASFKSELPPTTGTFAIAFRRSPRQFRFDNRFRLYSTREEHVFILTQDGKTTINEAGVSSVRHSEGEVDSLAPTTALMGPYIPELLMPDVFEKDFLSRLDFTSIETVTHNGQSCHVLRAIQAPRTVSGIELPAKEWSVWVRDSDDLIVRIVEGKNSADFSPRLNDSIKPDVFKRGPPEQ